MGAASVPQGVVFLDHTADVGLDVSAATLEELFTRAASGMAWLIQGMDLAGDTADVAAAPESGMGFAGARAAGPPVQRRVALLADDASTLLRAWLRELLRWHEAEGLALHGARFDVLTETRLEADVTLAPAATRPVREIKGVTLHGLLAERREVGWVGRVIFDV